MLPFLAALLIAVALSGCSDSKVGATTSIDIPDPKASGPAPDSGDTAPASRSGSGAPSEREAPASFLPGHSHRGQAFDEGPRERGRLLPGMPKVHFETSLEDPLAAQFFDQGVGQLHGFWSFEAERSFREVVKRCPEHPMGYWGIAMANTIFQSGNEKRARAALLEAKAKSDPAKISQAEIKWIAALEALYFPEGDERKDRIARHITLLKKIVEAYPDDLEAKAFYVVQQWDLQSDKMDRSALNEMIGDVLAAQPNHPIHHYKIHLWDGVDRSRALKSAAKAGESGPGIAHLWHMPAHIYSPLGRHRDAAWHLEASARVDHAHLIENRIMPYQIHNYFHNNGWFARELGIIGQARKSIAIAKNLIAIPRHPEHNVASYGGGGSFKGKEALFRTLLNFEMWEDALDLTSRKIYDQSSFVDEELDRLGLIAVASAFVQGGKFELAKRQLEEFKANLADKVTQAELEGKQKAADRWINYVSDVAAVRTTSERLRQEGRLMSVLKGLISSSGFEASTVAVMALDAGEKELAERIARDAIDEEPGDVVTLANLIYVLYHAGHREEARHEFEQLRELSEGIDLETRPFSRLKEIAASFAFPEDWRQEWRWERDFGPRPPLKSLGKFVEFEPFTAPRIPFVDISGNPFSAGPSEKPKLIIFYLGAGCLHCKEQISKHLVAKLDEILDAKFEVFAVSPEDEATLRQNVESFAEETSELGKAIRKIHFVSDPGKKLFDAFQVMDAFQADGKAPELHGTFVVDPRGRILWQDIGADPFNDFSFLLEESNRLLSLYGIERRP